MEIAQLSNEFLGLILYFFVDGNQRWIDIRCIYMTSYPRYRRQEHGCSTHKWLVVVPLNFVWKLFEHLWKDLRFSTHPF
jgi:hypothetical protein